MAEEDKGTDEPRGTEVDSTGKMPENVPDAPGAGEQIGRREGMFGVGAPATPPATAA